MNELLMPEMNQYFNSLNRICEDVHQPTRNGEEIDWDVEVEIKLFKAMQGLKPVGVNRYFMMSLIHQRFSMSMSRDMSSKAIWDHLDSMYDMAALHDSEIIPFPNDEKDFELPEECSNLVKDKFGVALPDSTDENKPPKNDSKSAKKPSLLSKLKPNTLVSSPKSPFLAPTPVSGKSSKSCFGTRNEAKMPNIDNSVKVKNDSPTPAKSNKVKRSLSPFVAKNGKPEIPQVKEESSDVKKPKNEKVKQEPTNSSTKKPAKTETPDSSKKNRNDKDTPNKKGKTTPVTESSVKKNSKSDGKKSEADGTPKKSDGSGKLKNDSKNAKGKVEEVESSHSTGSRKSANAAKVDSTDKKRKRQKLEDSAKKVTPVAKRRRT